MAQMMANHHSYHCTLYECVDQSSQSVPGSLSDTNGALFYQTQDQILADLNFFYMAITLQTLILYTVTELVDIVQRCKFKRQRGVKYISVVHTL